MGAEASKCDTYRLLLVGCVGAGKSSLGNAILGKVKFQAQAGMGSVTDKCSLQTERRGNIQLEVVDSPGFCDRKRSDEENSKLIAQFLAGVSPGPHAVLVVMKANDRFHSDLDKAYTEAKVLLEKQNLASRTILVFTGGDLLKQDKKTLEDELKKADDKLTEMIKDAEERYVLFNNKAKGGESENQLKKLLELVQKVTPDGSYLSSRAQQEINIIINKEAESLSNEKKISKKEAEEKIRRAMAQAEPSDDMLERAAQVVIHQIHNHRAAVVVKICSVM